MRILLKAARRHIIHVNVMNIHMEAKVPFAAHLHDIPRPFWIAAMVLAFIWHWPIGLAVLAYLIGSGRLRRGPSSASVGSSARRPSTKRCL